MANKEPKGAYNRAPIFEGENYDYWKECLSIHIQSVDMDVWDAVANRRFQPQVFADGVAQDKSKADWSDDDKKRSDTMNIIFSSPLLVLISIILYLLVRPPNICGMHWKHFTKEPMKLNNKKLIPLCNNMSFSVWKLVKPSPPRK
jgi:hypothetical protein